MTVTIADKLVQGRGDLSEPARLVLSVIDGGDLWIDWAVADAATYAFADESGLVEGVQTGLHAARLILLSKLDLRVGPVKLMTLSAADLRILLQVEQAKGSAVSSAQVLQVLARHGLVTDAELASVGAWLVKLGVAQAAALLDLNLEARLALGALASGAENVRASALEKEAATFAAGRAQSALEFVDYYRLYIALARRAVSTLNTPGKRAAAVQSVLNVLTPWLFGALDCPNVGGLVSPAEIAEAVSAWLGQGRRLGFARLSAAARQIVEHADVLGEDGKIDPPAIKAAVDNQWGKVDTLLAGVPVERGRMGQDGASASFVVAGGGAEARLVLRAGLIMLDDYSPKPQEASS